MNCRVHYAALIGTICLPHYSSLLNSAPIDLAHSTLASAFLLCIKQNRPSGGTNAHCSALDDRRIPISEGDWQQASTLIAGPRTESKLELNPGPGQRAHCPALLLALTSWTESRPSLLSTATRPYMVMIQAFTAQHYPTNQLRCHSLLSTAPTSCGLGPLLGLPLPLPPGDGQAAPLPSWETSAGSC